MSELHVVFGTGPLGRSVMKELVRGGKTVRMVNGSGSLPEIPEGVELVAGNGYDARTVGNLTQGAAVVYQCAQPSYNQWPEKFPALQAAILEGTAASGAKLVIAENLYMYGDTGGRPMVENLPSDAHTRKGKTRAEMAAAALAAHQAGKVRVALGRGSDFFGPWALGSTMGERVFYPALAGKSAQLTGSLDQPHTHTYIEDFGKALVILGERDEALGQAWHVPNDRPQITQRQFATMVFEELGLPPKMSGMGKTMMRLGGLFILEARETVEMMYEFEKPFVVDSSKFEQAFGVTATPLPEAIAATVAWYRAHPEGGGH